MLRGGGGVALHQKVMACHVGGGAVGFVPGQVKVEPGAVKVEREVRGLFTDTFVNKPLSYRALTSGKPCRGA